MSEKIRIKWTVQASISQCEIAMSFCGDDIDFSDLDSHYEGYVIDTVKSILGTTYFVVACTDNRVREVSINDVKIVNNEDCNKIQKLVKSR